VAAEVLSSTWPLLVTMAVAGGARIKGSRQRRALNRALHELRRPLQALALAPGSSGHGSHGTAPGALELALVALDDLDVAINGTRPALSRRPVAARPLVSGALDRWRGVAAMRERSLALEWGAGEAVVMADPARLAQALDNLLANAIEHGALRVLVRGSRAAGRLRISVTTAAGPPARRNGGPRRGHGLAVVRTVAAAHLGRFSLRRSEREVTATLELPLAPGPAPATPIEWAPQAA
jgi:signal transduction histidine kinase